jgi:signal transduction histidine kinase/CHASE3 domain sensor protein
VTNTHRRSFPGPRGGLTARAIYVSLLLATLGGLFAAILVAGVEQQGARRVLHHSQQELSDAQQLQQRVVDIETAERGFVLTGDQRFLEPWNTATRGFESASAGLIRVSDEPAQAALAREISRKATAYVRGYSEPTVRARRRDDPSAASVATAVRGVHLMDAMRASFARYMAVERREVARHESQVEGAVTRSVAMAIGGLIGSFVLIVMISLYLKTAIVRPIRRAAATAVDMADGDLATRMPETSVGEIGELERVFNRMGRSLQTGRAELHGVAEEQAALLRVATLVGAGGTPEDIFGAVSDEVRQLVGIDITSMFRFEPDATLTLLAVRSRTGGVLDDVIGRRVPVRRGFRELLERGTPLRLDAARVARWIKDIPKASDLGLNAAVGVPIIVAGRPWGAIFACATSADALPPGAEAPFAHFTKLVATAIANAQARSELSQLAEEQAALRRVATLVITGASPEDVYRMVAEEVAGVIGADMTGVHQSFEDGSALRLASWDSESRPLPIGERRPQEPDIDRELHAGRTVRVVTTGKERPGTFPHTVAQRGASSFIGVPIVVQGHTWGSIFAATTKPEPFPPDAEERMLGFTDLVATAVSAAAARAELAASNERLAESRARVVAAADEERARVVRDIHDGAQQRLVHALITLKLARRALTHDGGQGAAELVDEALSQAQRANVELRDLAHGIMPSVLTRGGLLAGVRSLVKHSILPVEVEVLAERLPSHVEASAYFIVAEALTNVLKHANAGHAAIRAFRQDDVLTIEVRDDGVGGARLSGSTGLLGLQDRAVAVSGTLHVESPPGGGTVLTVTLPLEPEPSADDPPWPRSSRRCPA